MQQRLIPASLRLVAMAWRALLLPVAMTKLAAAPFLAPAIDGDLREWDAPAGSAVGLAACADRLYLRFSLPEPVVLQDASGVVIYIDSDGDAATGLPAHGLGAEIRWDAGLRSGWAYTWGDEGLTSRSIRHTDLDLRAAPVLDSRNFELSAIRPAGEGTCRVAVEQNGELIGSASAICRTDRPVRSLSSARAAHTDLRLLAYNVLQDDFLDAPAKKDRFFAELAALQPDVICFTEIYNHSAEITRVRAAEVLPYLQHASGDGSMDCRIVSRHPIIFSESSWAFHCARVRSEDGTVDVMTVTAHLRCCTADDVRAGQLAAIANFVARLRAGQLAGVPPDLPVIMAGDLNLVRRDTTAFLALQEATGLRSLPALHLDSLDDYTWRDDGSSFSPGRLDYILAGPGLVARHAFVYKSVEPPSDHLPLVADLAVDADSNGLGDTWEGQYFESAGQLPGADPDNDGFTNDDEQRLGTHPRQASDRPQLVAETGAEGLRLRLTGHASGRAAFKLWRSSDLVGWEAVPGRWRPDDSALPVELQGPRLFFRAAFDPQ